MTRRRLLAMAGALAPAPAAAQPPGYTCRIRRLTLRHTWTTTMSSSDYRDTVFVEIARDGLTGVGEGAPIVRYNESAQTALTALQPLGAFVASADLREYRKVIAQAHQRLGNQWAAKAAFDIAAMDWTGQKLGVPLYRLFGLDPTATPETSFSIGIDTPEITRQKVREAAGYPILKIKVGLDTDEATMAAVRAETNQPLRVDANEGWKTKEEAVRKINWLEKNGVEFVEQPMPAAMLQDMNWVRARVHIPVIADEACLHPADIPKLAPHFDGVNIKLDKCGGMLEALRMIEMARSLGLKTMLGCMISSSASITAAAHLSPLVDYADLDGNLLISNDPYAGARVLHGKLVLSTRPGLGLVPAAR
jgi:L-alanine-DL-glutamate epimerase-like enolase superfamily enzyme